MSASLWTTLLCPFGAALLGPARAAAADYAKAVHGKKNHGLGSPHVHIAAAFLEAAAASKKLGEAERAWLTSALKTFEAEGGQQLLAEVIPHFRLRDLRARKGKGKGRRDEGDPPSSSQIMDVDGAEGVKEEKFERTLVTMSFNPLAQWKVKHAGQGGDHQVQDVAATTHLREVVLKVLLAEGGELAQGGAPASNLERMVQKDVEGAGRRKATMGKSKGKK